MRVVVQGGRGAVEPDPAPDLRADLARPPQFEQARVHDERVVAPERVEPEAAHARVEFVHPGEHHPDDREVADAVASLPPDRTCVELPGILPDVPRRFAAGGYLGAGATVTVTSSVLVARSELVTVSRNFSVAGPVGASTVGCAVCSFVSTAGGPPTCVQK